MLAIVIVPPHIPAAVTFAPIIAAAIALPWVLPLLLPARRRRPHRLLVGLWLAAGLAGTAVVFAPLVCQTWVGYLLVECWGLAI